MNFKIEDGANFITLGYSSIGSYLKIQKPVSLIWYDCCGSVAQYLCMVPCSETTRQELHTRITNSLYEDFTGRLDELYLVLQPLFSLFENGDYWLGYYDGTKRPLTTSYSGGEQKTYERGWYTLYPEVVDLSQTDELKEKYREDTRARGLPHHSSRLVGFTSTWIYDSWTNDIYIATRPLAEINADRVKYFEEKIAAGERPFVIIINAFYQKTHDYSGDFVLDGHHKLQAYQNMGIDPPSVVITRHFALADNPEFDLEGFAQQLYPWQIRHIIDNWDEEEDGELTLQLKSADSRLNQFIKHGPVKKYYENDQLKREAYYINDQLHGKALAWYRDGKPEYERFYNNGKATGTWKAYYPSGQIRSITPYDDGHNQHGEVLAYYENGQKLRSELFSHGKYKDGTSFHHWHENGNKGTETKYLDGQVIEKLTWSGDGRMISREVYDEIQKRLVAQPITVNDTYSAMAVRKPQARQEDLNRTTMRAYPETPNIISWRWFALLILVLLQLLRMCH